MLEIRQTNTGLKDKNGEDLFLYDLIEWNKNKFFVASIGGKWVFQPEFRSESSYIIASDFCKDCTRIGNVRTHTSEYI